MARAKRTRYVVASEPGVARPWMVVDTERRRVIGRHHEERDATDIAAAMEASPQGQQAEE